MYCLVNFDANELIASSGDRGILEELMLDMFFEDVYDEFCWNVGWPDSMAPEILANDAWYTMLDWYSDYISIEEVPFFE